MVALVVGAILVQQFAQLPGENQMLRSLSNWAHVTMFVAITFAVMRILGGRLVLVFCVVAALALLSEGVQLFTARQASLADLGRDLLGCAIALVCMRPGHRRLAYLGGLLTVLITLTVPGIILAAYVDQRLQFPVLYEPARLLGRVLVSVQPSPSTHTVTVHHPWAEYARKPVLDVTWQSAPWPGVHLTEPLGDWRNYSEFNLDVYNANHARQPITVAVRHAHGMGTARYVRNELLPGHNRVRIDLARLARDDRGEWQEITHVILHTSNRHAGKRVLFGRVWLE